MKTEKLESAVAIYKSATGVEFSVRVENETVWLDAHQMAQLFEVDRTGIVRHIRNVYKTGELQQDATCAKIAQVAKDGRTRKMDVYNLDMVISVGYRVNSKKATSFRTWATSVLKQYLIQGYAVNQKRLEQVKDQFTKLQNTVQFLQSKVGAETLKGKEQDIFALLSEYSKTLSVLEQYDKDTLSQPKGKKATKKLTYEDAIQVLADVRDQLMRKGEATDMFARERGGEFEGIIRGLYQSFGGTELYPTIESKAAHLLYFVIKDHPFSDGNKRSASFLFVYFLDKNKHLYKKNGERKINDNALAALALLVAESDPKEKDTMVQLVENLIAS